MEPAPNKILYFKSAAAFRKWLQQNHTTEKEIFAGYYKVSTGKSSMTWSESVDQALCFGWIDGIRKSIDDESYCIRFTPRKATSVWSLINLKKVDELMKQGLMQPAGLEIFNKRKEHRTGIYAYENLPTALSKVFEKKFRANKKAWAYFQSCPPSYHKVIIKWVMSAKQETTRISRLMETCEAGNRL